MTRMVCQSGGARAVAVASGWTERATLAALAPDALLDSLQPPAALAAILDEASPSRTAATSTMR